MKNVRSILLATDYRTLSRDAAIVAARLAQVFGAKIHVVHVVHSTSDSASVLMFKRQLSEHSQQVFLAQLASQNVPVEGSSMVYGSPANGIQRKADELDVDLIVLGAGERNEYSHFMAGPVAEAVMQHARQPVLAIRPGGPEVEFKKLLCPVDLSTVSRRGLRNAIRLAHAFQGELVVLSVIPELSWLGAAVETHVLAGAQQQHANDWEAEFNRFLAGTDLSGATWSRDLRIGAADRQIILAANEHRADLIVMGATGRTGLARAFMGSVTRRVLQHLPCSILTVQDEDLLREEPDEEDIRMSRLLYAEGMALLEGGSPSTALEKFGQVLARNPFHLSALEGRAEAYGRLGETERAAQCRRRAELLRHEAWV